MSNLTGTDKSVILLMTIGEDRAAEVFKHLSQREVQTLSAAMANVTQISNKQLTYVLAEFEQEAEQFAALNINANDYLRSVLVKALGEERAASLLEDILETRDTASGIETLNFMEPQSAADLIRDEHPQIIATILVHLKRAQAADILRDDLANRGPVRLSQVENEQKAILLIVRRLAETGEMVIGSGEDTYV
ncbi:FliG C-terminal domain-containing protein [Shigella sonnei]